MPDGQQRLIQVGLEALRDPEMERRVHAHLKGRGDSPRDLISAALVAARFHREQQGAGKVAQQAEALWEAQETTLDEMESLTRTLEREQGLTPEQAQTDSWESIRERYILLPPRAGTAGRAQLPDRRDGPARPGVAEAEGAR